MILPISHSVKSRRGGGFSVPELIFPINVSNMTAVELVDHILNTHHEYLKAEFPRLIELTEKVARVHGDKDKRLVALRDLVASMIAELSQHMNKEEQVLFPMIKELSSSDKVPFSS